MVFTSKHNIAITKSEKSLKKKIPGFFSIWPHPRKGVVQGFPNCYFQQIFRTALKQSENQTLKFSQVNLVSSFGDISKKPKGRAFLPERSRRENNGEKIIILYSLTNWLAGIYSCLVNRGVLLNDRWFCEVHLFLT